MSENKGPSPQEHRHDYDGLAGSLTMRQLRTVGQRRRDAEEKLAHHLEEVRRKDAVEKDGGELAV